MVSAVQGPAKWNPAPQIMKDTCKKAVQCAAEQGIDLPELAIKAIVASNPDISCHLVNQPAIQPSLSLSLTPAPSLRNDNLPGRELG